MAEVIAEKVQETNDKLDDPKSDEREHKNDLNNSGETGAINLESEIYSSWLEIVNLFQTFEDLESARQKEADIQAVRQLLDVEPNDH